MVMPFDFKLLELGVWVQSDSGIEYRFSISE